MFENYFVKNRFWYALLLSFITSLVFVSWVSLGHLNNEARKYDENSIYINSKVDFVVPSPTPSQIEEIKDLSFVENALGVFMVPSTSIAYKNSSNINNIHFLFSDDWNNLDFTMYNDVRLIEQSSIVSTNPVFVDYLFQKNTNTKLGDVISVVMVGTTISFTIDRIYETNTFYNGVNGVLIAPFIGVQKSIYESNVSKLSYAHAFLSANNYSLLNEYLLNYKPDGLLRDRSTFDSDEDYENHYNDWFDFNYSNQISNFTNNRNAIEQTLFFTSFEMVLSNFFIPLALFTFFSITYNALLTFRKNENFYFYNYLENMNLKKRYYYQSLVVELVASFMVIIIVTNLSLALSNYFVPILTSNIVIYSLLLVSLVSLCFNFWINLRSIQYSELNKSNKKVIQ